MPRLLAPHMAECHPQRPHRALGRCTACYFRMRRRLVAERDAYKARRAYEDALRARLLAGELVVLTGCLHRYTLASIGATGALQDTRGGGYAADRSIGTTCA